MFSFRMTSLFIASIATIALAGCAPKPAQPTPTPGISPEKKACMIRCVQQQDRCVRQYNKLYQQCAIQAKQQARQHFMIYVNQQKNARKKIQKTINDFLDFSHCRQQLNCKSNYQVCRESC